MNPRFMPMSARLGWALLVPLARMFAGARCVQAETRRDGTVVCATAWPPEGEALTVVIPTRRLLEELGASP